MRLGPLAMLLIVVFALSSNVCGVYWSSSVSANSSHWSIYRQSSNISFDLSSSVNGNISPVDISPIASRGRILSPYQSYYEEVSANDVRLRQRTSSLQGSYKSEDEIKMQSVVYPDEIEITVDKPAGTDLYTIEYKNEIWPVFIKASRALAYSGMQINNRDFEGNNGDFVGANFLYNHELSKEQMSIIWLKRLNATVLTTNDSIQLAEFKPTKYLGHEIVANTTGIADLSYLLRDSQYDVKHQNYPALSEREERYWGTYDLYRRINMKSVFEKINDTDGDADGWLPCCYAGWNDMMYFDKKSLGTDAKGVFDCTCYKEITKA
ncbi:MAG: hypothetical protein M0Q13_08915 [Methanothrix sp.]|nr:hypothetical protein [Methanothrix sp.]